MSLAIAIFVLAYVLIATEKISRIAIALGGAAAMLIIGATDSDKAFYSHETGIDWDVIFLLLGMKLQHICLEMVCSHYLIQILRCRKSSPSQIKFQTQLTRWLDLMDLYRVLGE